jgi:two-component system sensor histidine kinase BaeS
VNRDGIAARIALAALGVAGVTLAIVAIGVMRVGGDAFAAAMAAAGDSVEHARQMFDTSVSLVVLVAAVVAALGAVILAMVLAQRIARPIERLAEIAGRTAEGDLRTMAPDEGPTEVRALARAYNVLVDRLAEQEQIRREFVVNASHELRTPLTNLQGYLEALRDGVLPPDPATFDSLREEVDRLGRLAASLDLLAGGESERGLPGDVDLAAVVRTAADLAMPAFRRRSISLDVVAPGSVIVRARADELAQVLSNLLQNAIRYTPSGGTARLELERPEGQALVRVTNTGPGIPPADLPRVWERFYRVEKSRDRASGGAGIGLAIVKRLVEDAGGNVGATSGEGSTSFWFALPRA